MLAKRKVSNRRGAALILAAAMMFMLFGMLAFSVDSGYLAQTRSEITRCSDSAALAGCSDVYKQLDADVGLTIAELQVGAIAAANQYAAYNKICDAAPQLAAADVKVGYCNSMRGGTISNDSSQPFYAVQVTVNKSSQLNGQVPYFFGKIFGSTGRDMTSVSTAVMARKVSGFNTPSGSDTLNILPFALDETTWNTLMATLASGSSSGDNYRFDTTTQAITSGQDGLPEVNLFPQGTGSPGNRGTVDIGGANNSTNDIKRQILTGISAADLAALGKPLQLSPSSGTLTLNGDTGISAGVKDQLAQVIGHKRIIPIFRSVSGNGNNANYTIVKFVGIRVMKVQLTGSMNSKHLLVQPAAVASEYGVRSTTASASDFVLSPVLLSE
jgi:Flp pilus assembly protein TadG